MTRKRDRSAYPSPAITELLVALDSAPSYQILDETRRVVTRHHDVRELAVYLQDHGGQTLRHLESNEEIPIEYTSAGAAIGSTEIVTEDETVWVPLAHRAEPLGVLKLTNPDPQLRQSARALGIALGSALLSSTRQSDMVEITRGGGRLQLAATLQRAILPNSDYEDNRLELSGQIEPAYDIAGDSFDYAVDHIAHLAVFDAVGHGLRAAILSALATAAYRYARRREEPPEQAYFQIDQAVAIEGRSHEFVTGLLCRIDPDRMEATTVNAGHPPPLLWRQGRVEALDWVQPTLPLGLGGSPAEVAIRLEPGDTLLLYTDGIVDAAPLEGSAWGLERLVERLTNHHEAGSLSQFCRSLLEELRAYVGAELRDDATLLTVRVAR
jgi:phosphoserine phosphatase RsbU/P